MIKTTTTTKIIIEVSSEEVKRNFENNFKDILNDYDLMDSVSRELYQGDFHRLTDALDQMERGLYSGVFQEGYTAMLLSSSDFAEVEKFFDHRQPQTELEIHITSETPGTLFIVSEKDIQF
jgi:hypothetical protein